MPATLAEFFHFLTGFLKSRSALQLEILALRHQINVLQRKSPKRPKIKRWDRLFWVLLLRTWSDWRLALLIVKPETVIRWHREGFRRYWRWKSRRRKAGGRQKVSHEVRDLIRRMSRKNPLWGAPRIHGELLKLGYQVAEASVSKYMPPDRKPPSQTWKTFLENHASQIVAMDFFTVPTILFQVIHVLIFLSHDRRRIIHFNLTTNPNAAWVAQQIRSAFPWDSAPKYLLHDRDPLFQAECKATIRAMGLQEVISAPASPWQNAFCERVIGSLRQEILDHVIVMNEEHLRGILREYLAYYHGSRTHLGLAKDCPDPRPIQPRGLGEVVALPHLGGLHHGYQRKAA